VNFPSAARWFRNAEVTGIPVRPEFFSLPQPPEMPLHLLIFGGSQGARLFNNTVPKIMPRLLAAVPGLTVLHQCGPRFVAETEAMYRASGADPLWWTVKPFLDDMPSRFSRANLVLARSGASTVAELAAAGKPSLLVPFAAAADDHQKRNAQEMVRVGAAVMLEERDLASEELLLSALVDLLRNPGRLVDMAAAARTQAHPDAAERIAARLVALAKSK
jgi:UDP-N-acetylglucosamine--N-acetylmuramyl-(pentapeptide) pyrophosphoryl-undecaprenol N-acetylglucosamine transferase